MLLVLIAALCLPPAGPLGAEIVSYAIVRDDGTLLVSGKKIKLYGIYIPPTDRTCRRVEIPIRCGPRAILALDFKIASRFVHCQEMEDHADGTISAICRIDDEDLGAWLLTQGWAVATPDAPFEYQTLEKIARTQRRGIWGWVIDSF